MEKPEGKEILTKENAHKAATVSCIANPEWGTKSFNYNEQPLTEEEAKANAKLIAAAPDLFKALNSIVLSIKSHPDYVFGKDEDEWHDLISISEQALKKATE